MVVRLAEAQADLGPYTERLRRCVQAAIDTYQAEMGQYAYRHSKRTQASLVHDYMVDAVTTEFANEPGVTWTTKRNLFTVNFFNKYLIKLKKHDRRLRTRNIATQLVLDWLEQKQLELPGMPDAATNLHLGYQPGMSLSQSRYWLSCPDGSSLEWTWELAASEPIDLPIAAPERVRPARPRIAEGVEPAAKGTADGVGG